MPKILEEFHPDTILQPAIVDLYELTPPQEQFLRQMIVFAFALGRTSGIKEALENGVEEHKELTF